MTTATPHNMDTAQTYYYLRKAMNEIMGSNTGQPKFYSFNPNTGLVQTATGRAVPFSYYTTSGAFADNGFSAQSTTARQATPTKPTARH